MSTFMVNNIVKLIIIKLMLPSVVRIPRGFLHLEKKRLMHDSLLTYNTLSIQGVPTKKLN